MRSTFMFNLHIKNKINQEKIASCNNLNEFVDKMKTEIRDKVREK